MSRFEFVRVGPTGAVTGRRWAESVREAARLMVAGPGEYVTSAASHAIGVPRAVRAALAKAPKAPTEQQAETRRANVAKATRDYRARHREATPLAPAVVREGRAQLAHAMDVGHGKRVWQGRPKKASTLESKRRHERKPERREAKTAWQRAKRRGEQ